MLRGESIGWVISLAIIVACGCGRGGAVAEAPSNGVDGASPSKATDRGNVPQHAGEPIREGIVIGEFPLPDDAVIDGDTIRVKGVVGSIRLLGIDTEEKARSRRDRAAMETDFERYLMRKRGNSKRPVKAATPMGDEATEFAKSFFDEAEVVRLERDDSRSLRGRFGRPLAYVFVRKDGRWVSYNVEAVRAGMSPYFTKYGYSRRFHTQFARAETEAREAQAGIWNPAKDHYDDYDERQAWWNARADFLQALEHEDTGNDDLIKLDRFDAENKLEQSLGKRVTVVGPVDDIERFKGLVRVTLAGSSRQNFPIIFRDVGLYKATGLAKARGEPAAVQGVVERYKKGSYETLQIVVTDASQVRLVSDADSPEETAAPSVR